MTDTPIETRAHWTATMYADPKSMHRDASPPISLCVLYGLVEQAKAAGYKWLSVDELETALDHYAAMSATRTRGMARFPKEPDR